MKIKRLTEDTLVARALGWLARSVFHHRRWFLYPQILLFVICMVYTARYLGFDTNRDDLVGSNK